MATRLDQIKQALIAADKAGATDDARALAEAYRLEQAREAQQQALAVNEATPTTATNQYSSPEEILAFDRAAAQRALDAWEASVGDLGTMAATSLNTAIESTPSGVRAGVAGGLAAAARNAEGQSWLEAANVAPSWMDTLPGSAGLRQLGQLGAKGLASIGAAGPLQASANVDLQRTLNLRMQGAQELQKLKQEYQQGGGSEFAADVAAGIGGSASSFAPLIGAAVTGAVTRSPAAAFAAQAALAPLPALQAYADSYAEYKATYPEASEEDAQTYATAASGLEYLFEMVPGGAGRAASGTLKQIAVEAAKRTGKEVVTEVGTEANTQLLQRALAPELAPQGVGESAYNMAVAGATAGVVSGPVSSLGAYIEARPRSPDPVVDAGIQAGAAQTADVEQAIADVIEATPEVTPEAAPKAAPTKQLDLLPTEAPTIKDMFSGVETEALAPTETPEPLTRAQRLEQRATQLQQSTVQIDDTIDGLLEQKTRIVPTGPKGGYSRADRVAIEKIDRKILDLQAKKRDTVVQATNAQADATSARLELPEQGTRPEADVRRDYLLTMQGRQFDQNEQARLGEMEAQGATPTGDLFQPTKPRIRVEPEPIQGELGLPKPRIRVGEDLRQAPTPIRDGTFQQGELALDTSAKALASPAKAISPRVATQPLVPAPTPATEAPRAPEAPRARTVTEVTPEGDVVTEPAFAPADKERARVEAMFADRPSVVRDQEVVQPTSPVLAQSNTVPPEQRNIGKYEQELSTATNAKQALEAIRRRTDPKSPYARVIVSLMQSPFLETTGFKVVQPEEASTIRGSRHFLVKGSALGQFQAYKDGSRQVLVRGSGFKENGMASVETTLHELVHAATEDVVRQVETGKITDAKSVLAVKEIKAIQQQMAAAVERGDLAKANLTPDEKQRVLYASTNKDKIGAISEFLSVSLSSPAFQSAMKLKGVWDTFVNAIRNLFSIRRSDKELFDKILDAGINVIQQQTAQADTIRANNQQTGETTTREMATTPTTRSARTAAIRKEAGLGVQKTPKPDNIRAEAEGWGAAGLAYKTTKLYDATKDFLVRMLTSTQGVDTATKTAERLAAGTKQEADLIIDGFLNSVQEVSSALNTDPKLAKQIQDRAANFLKGNEDALKLQPTDTRPLRIRIDRITPVLQKARAEMDSLSTRIGQEIIRAYEGKDMPASVVEKLKTIKSGMGQYLSRVYEAHTNRNYSETLWKRYKDGDAGAKAVIEPLLTRLTGQISSLGANLAAAKVESDKANQALADTGKKETTNPWSTANWEKVSPGITLEQMYRDLLGSPGQKTREIMFNELSSFVEQTKDSTKTNVERAERVVQDILGVYSKDNPLSSFWRGMRSDDRALRDRTDVPQDVKRVLGEIVDPFMTVAYTLSRQSAALANLKANNALFDMSPDRFVTPDQRVSGVHEMAIPNNPIVYGKLAGMYTDKYTHSMIVAQQDFGGHVDSIADALDSIARAKDTKAKVGVAAKATATAFTKLSGFGKFATIAANTGNALLDLLGNYQFMVVAGNTDVSTWKDGVKYASGLFGSNFRKEYVPELRRLVSLGIIDPTMTQVDETVRQAMRETEITKKLIRRGAAAETLHSITGRAITAITLIREGRALLENIPKIANFLNNEKVLKKAFPNLSKGEIEILAAEKTLRTSINYSMVPQAIKFLETTSISYIASFYSESLRTGFTNITEGIREIRSGNPTMRNLGIKRVVGATVGLYTLNYLVATALGSALGAMELDEEWEDLMTRLGYGAQGQQKVVLDVLPDGTVISVDVGRGGGMDVYSMQARNLMSITEAFLAGDDEAGIERVKGAAGGLVDMFFSGAPLGTAVAKLVTGSPRSASFKATTPEWYDSYKDFVGEVTGSAQAVKAADGVAGLFDLVTPGALKQYARGAYSGDVERDGMIALAQQAGLPVTYDNPYRELVGFKATSYLRARREGTQPVEDVVTLLVDRPMDELVSDAVDRYIDTQRQAYTDLAKQVEVARATNRILNLSEQEGVSRIENALLENTGFSKDDAKALARGEPYKPRPPSRQFLNDAIKRSLDRIPTDTQAGVRRRAELETKLRERRTRIVQEINDRIKQWDNQE